MLEFANRNADLILQNHSQRFCREYLHDQTTSGLIFAIAGKESFMHGYPVAPSTTTVFAIKNAFQLEMARFFRASPPLPLESAAALNSSLEAGMMTLDLLAFMKLCESEARAEDRVNQLVRERIFDKSTAEQMMPLCRPAFPRLIKGVADEKLIDVLQDTLQTDINTGRLSVAEVSGIEMMFRLYRQTYPYAKSFRAEETRKLFEL